MVSRDVPKKVLGQGRGASMPDEYHHYVGGKDACDGEIAAMKLLGVELGCRHKPQP